MTRSSDDQVALPGLHPSSFSLHPSKKHYAAIWTADAKQFADSLVAEWNKAFGAAGRGTRAYATRRNHFAAVQLYRFINGPQNDGNPKLTEEDIRKAIRLYADDPHIIKHCGGRFLDFGSWVRGCPENADKQLARIGTTRGSCPLSSGQVAGRKFAEQLLSDKPYVLGDAARRATDANLSIGAHAESMRSDLAARPRQDPTGNIRRYYGLLINLFVAWAYLGDNQRAAYIVRALHGVAALRGRALNKTLEDANLRDALALALFARDRQNPAREGGSDDVPSMETHHANR